MYYLVSDRWDPGFNGWHRFWRLGWTPSGLLSFSPVPGRSSHSFWAVCRSTVQRHHSHSRMSPLGHGKTQPHGLLTVSLSFCRLHSDIFSYLGISFCLLWVQDIIHTSERTSFSNLVIHFLTCVLLTTVFCGKHSLDLKLGYAGLKCVKQVLYCRTPQGHEPEDMHLQDPKGW